ncbi:MAG: hypothetical protein V4506_13570 [Bacteroidota bacterium]
MICNYFKAIYISVLVLSFSSCDAYISLSYVVKNKTSEPVKVWVPNYSRDHSPYGKRSDTVLVIAPHDYERVGGTMPDIGFPWATRRIYRESPALCGLKLIKADTTIEIPCTKKKWKYRHGASRFTIRKNS